MNEPAETCPNCGGSMFSWDWSPLGAFALGCDECSETIRTAHPDDVAAYLNATKTKRLRARKAGNR